MVVSLVQVETCPSLCKKSVYSCALFVFGVKKCFYDFYVLLKTRLVSKTSRAIKITMKKITNQILS